MDPVIAERLGPDHPLARRVDDFLTDLRNAGKRPHTIRAYRGDLIQFAAHHDDGLAELTAEPVRAYLKEIAPLSDASRQRKQAALGSFTQWAVRHELLNTDPMARFDKVRTPKREPRPANPEDVKKVLDAICPRSPRKDVPLDRLRDRVLFELAYACGGRASEACGVHVEDLDMRLDDEHIEFRGKGGKPRKVLLADPRLVRLLRLYLDRSGYTHGPLFRASINGRGGPISYSAAWSRWTHYCAKAGVDVEIHQLRHSHATELINSGVSIETVRRRLGHAKAETTQLYAQQSDKVADAEIRAARRRAG